MASGRVATGRCINHFPVSRELHSGPQDPRKPLSPKTGPSSSHRAFHSNRTKVFLGLTTGLLAICFPFFSPRSNNNDPQAIANPPHLSRVAGSTRTTRPFSALIWTGLSDDMGEERNNSIWIGASCGGIESQHTNTPPELILCVCPDSCLRTPLRSFQLNRTLALRSNRLCCLRSR